MHDLKSLLPNEMALAPKWKTKGYTAIANSLVLNKKISAGACRVQMYLLIRCFNKDFSYPSYETMAKDLGMARKSVYNYLMELKKVRLIKTQRRRNKSNIYFLKF